MKRDFGTWLVFFFALFCTGILQNFSYRGFRHFLHYLAKRPLLYCCHWIYYFDL